MTQGSLGQKVIPAESAVVAFFSMHRTHEFKLYPTKSQEATLETWLRRCCWVYNRALEHRIKAYKRRKQSVSRYEQYNLLAEWRKRISCLSSVPSDFQRDAMRRVDLGMKAFFRRFQAGEKPGFPRFKSSRRYNSMAILDPRSYVHGNKIRIPKIGLIKCSGQDDIPTSQKSLKIIRRASGWYAQVVVETDAEQFVSTGEYVGVDVGLTSFAALSTGETIENPRWARRSQRQVAHAQRRVSRRKKGSKNRRKAVKRVAMAHEKITSQRKDFCHQLSRRLVNEYDLIAIEKLNVTGLSRGRLSRSIMDAGWSILFQQLTYKAESAGKLVVAVDPRGTSQTCPECGVVKKKELRERVHACNCGCVIDRDVAAARVILSRALRVVGASACGGNVRPEGMGVMAVPVKHEVA